MMRFIQLVVFCGNVLLLLGVNIYLWTVSWCCGIGGLFGIVGFFIGYSISDGMRIAPRDYWRLPKYNVFKKKIAYGNSIAGGTTVVASCIVYVIWMAITGNY